MIAIVGGIGFAMICIGLFWRSWDRNAIGPAWWLGIGAVLFIIFAMTGPANSFGVGQQGKGFGKLGAIPKNKGFVPPPSCGSPTAPNGVVDLSQCSNAFYAAVIF